MFHTANSVKIHAPARLHMGFLDLNGSLGRRFGSLGLALNELATVVTLRPATGFNSEGPQSSRAESFARRLMTAKGLGGSAQIQVHQAIPPHSGLGSGTQMALAVGTAIANLHGFDWPLPEMAREMRRGERSGIGLGLFDRGGFVVDGGRGEADRPPAVISRLAFPAQWRLILVFDRDHIGLHGKQEKLAFASLPEFPEAGAAHLCRLTLMQALPALAEQDIDKFGEAISEIQEIVGDHFAPAQGGRFASPRVEKAVYGLKRKGAQGIGQSSWGPTGFALTNSETQAHTLAMWARHEYGHEGLDFMVCSGRNKGAEIQVDRQPAADAGQMEKIPSYGKA